MGEISKRQLEIISATGSILTQSGVLGLTIKKLAEEMKFSESAIYRHFPSKENIIITMLEYLGKDMDSRFSFTVRPDLSPEDQFIKMFKNQLDFCLQHPHFVVAVFSEGLMENSQKISESILNIMEIKKKYLLPIITKGQEDQVFRTDIPAEDLINIILGTYRLLMFEWKATQFKSNITKKGNTMIKNILMLIKK